MQHRVAKLLVLWFFDKVPFLFQMNHHLEQSDASLKLRCVSLCLPLIIFLPPCCLSEKLPYPSIPRLCGSDKIHLLFSPGVLLLLTMSFARTLPTFFEYNDFMSLFCISCFSFFGYQQYIHELL